MKASILTFSFFTALVVAAPALETRDQNGYPWTPALAGYYEKIAQYIQEARQVPGGPKPPSCNLASATLPVAPTPLPSPDGLKLSFVALGRGIQVCQLTSLYRPPN